MSSNFLIGGGTVLGLNTGTANLNVNSLCSQNLSVNQPLKTDAQKCLVSSLLAISDTVGLQSALDLKTKLGFTEGGTPITPAAGEVCIYSKTDGNMYQIDDAGLETKLTQDLQGVYDNSSQPQITTSTALGAVQIKRGSALDSDSVFEVLDGSDNVNLEVGGDGTIIQTHTATEADQHTLEIIHDSAGFNDTKAIDIVYTTGASTGEEEAILITVDKSSSSSGNVSGYTMLATEGSANATALTVGVGIDPLLHEVGSFANPSTGNIDNNGATVAVGSLSGVNLWVNDNDYVIVADAAQFEEMEFLLGQVASGGGIAPTFEYSTGTGPLAFSAFSPTDGTNGMRNTGVVEWTGADVPAWVADGGVYKVRITRTRNTLTTVPQANNNGVKIASVDEFGWDKSANVSCSYLEIKDTAPILRLTDTNSSGVNTVGSVIFTDSLGVNQGNLTTNTDGLKVESKYDVILKPGSAANGNIECDTTDGAFIPPVETTTQRNAITGAQGMLIYNSTTNGLNFYNGTSWVDYGGRAELPFMHLRMTAVQTTTTGANWVCEWPAGGELKKVNMTHDTSTAALSQRLQANIGGYYQVSYEIYWDFGAANDLRYHSIVVDGASGVNDARYARLIDHNISGEQKAVVGSAIVPLAANSYLELYVQQGSGGNLGISSASLLNQCEISIYWVRPL